MREESARLARLSSWAYHPRMADETALTREEPQPGTAQERGDKTWAEIMSAHRDAEERANKSWTEILAAHHDAQERADKSWAAVDAKTRKA